MELRDERWRVTRCLRARLRSGPDPAPDLTGGRSGRRGISPSCFRPDACKTGDSETTAGQGPLSGGLLPPRSPQGLNDADDHDGRVLYSCMRTAMTLRGAIFATGIRRLGEPGTGFQYQNIDGTPV